MSLISHDYLTVAEFARAKDVSERTVYYWMQSKIAPPFVMEHRQYWFLKADVERFVKPKRGRRKGHARTPEAAMKT